MSVPRIYAAINAVQSELAVEGIRKAHLNTRDDYAYRSIDDVMAKLAPMLARYKLCLLPRVLERTAVERLGEQAELLISVSLRTAFDMVCAEDGSMHRIEVFAEALDGGDKATAKAMSSAFKQAMLQAFCIPVSGQEEPDRTSYRLRRSDHPPEPPQGWEQWSCDILEIVRVCQTDEALERVQATHRLFLKAVSTERPDLYKAIGEGFQARRRVIAAPVAIISAKDSAAPRTRRARSAANGGAVHA